MKAIILSATSRGMLKLRSSDPLPFFARGEPRIRRRGGTAPGAYGGMTATSPACGAGGGGVDGFTGAGASTSFAGGGGC